MLTYLWGGWEGRSPARQMPREWPETFLRGISRDVAGCRVQGHPGRPGPPKSPKSLHVGQARPEWFLAGPGEENSGAHTSKPHTRLERVPRGILKGRATEGRGSWLRTTPGWRNSLSLATVHPVGQVMRFLDTFHGADVHRRSGDGTADSQATLLSPLLPSLQNWSSNLDGPLTAHIAGFTSCRLHLRFSQTGTLAASRSVLEKKTPGSVRDQLLGRGPLEPVALASGEARCLRYSLARKLIRGFLRSSRASRILFPESVFWNRATWEDVSLVWKMEGRCQRVQ